MTDSKTTEDQWGIVANVARDAKCDLFRHGAKLWLMWVTGGGMCFERAKFCGLSPGGRIIEAWISFRDLENFRAAWVPPAARRTVRHTFKDKAEATEWARDIMAYRGGSTPTTALPTRSLDGLELHYHPAMPNWCKLKGLKIRAIPECEGGGFAVDRRQAEAIIALLQLPRSE
jgi:hypothetical protein